MQQLIFATNNANKVKEVQGIVPANINIISLKQAGISQEIDEPFDSFHENAKEKTSVIHARTAQNCFGEDSGLCVQALNGAPGVRSARYAGEPADSIANMQKLLQEMDGVTNRAAYFITVISLIWEGQHYFFEGRCDGTITSVPRGNQGFGYDPIFIPLGATKTFGEMSSEEKKQYSHRAKAVNQLLHFLNTWPDAHKD